MTTPQRKRCLGNVKQSHTFGRSDWNILRKGKKTRDLTN